MASVEGEPGDRQGAGARQVGEPHRARRQLAVEHRTAAHFRPVVILGVDPEHRHHRHAVLGRDLRRQLHRGDGLEQREQRTAEQPGLLAGNDDARGGIGQPRRRLARGGGRAASRLLGRDHARDVSRLSLMSLRSLDGVGPRSRRRGIAGEERRDPLKIKGIVRRQAPNPRECSDVHRKRRGGSGRDFGWHCDVLSQTVTNTVNLA